VSLRVLLAVLSALGVSAVCGAVGAQSADDWTPPGHGVAADSQISAPAVAAEQQAPSKLTDGAPPPRALGWYPPPPMGAFAPMPSNADFVEGDQRSRSVWYGWQTLTVDGAAGALIALGTVIARNDSDNAGSAFSTVGFLTYLGGAPVIHGFHGRPGIMLADFGVRIAAPIVGAVVGNELADCSSGDINQLGCDLTGAGLGILAGMGTAIAIDSAIFARESRPAPRTKSARAFSVMPSLSLTPHRSELTLVGTF
jgi:hypothetical protein